jgi:hypothetical protein
VYQDLRHCATPNVPGAVVGGSSSGETVDVFAEISRRLPRTSDHAQRMRPGSSSDAKNAFDRSHPRKRPSSAARASCEEHPARSVTADAHRGQDVFGRGLGCPATSVDSERSDCIARARCSAALATAGGAIVRSKAARFSGKQCYFRGLARGSAALRAWPGVFSSCVLVPGPRPLRHEPRLSDRLETRHIVTFSPAKER